MASDLPGARAAFKPSAFGPAIASVAFHYAGPARYRLRTYTVTIKGAGFGSSPRPTPFVGVTDRFRIANNAQLGFAEYGFAGDHRKLDHRLWSETEIVVRGFKARPGDSAVIALWDEKGRGATWGGNVPPCPSGAPRIEKVAFDGGGRNLRIRITGSGFGRAPRKMPYRGNLDHFSFSDFRTHSAAGSALFAAGFTGFDRHAPHRVFLRYRSWADRRIEIDGFCGQYGRNDATVRPGDPAAIVIWNSDAKNAEDPQTAWAGVIGI